MSDLLCATILHPHHFLTFALVHRFGRKFYTLYERDKDKTIFKPIWSNKFWIFFEKIFFPAFVIAVYVLFFYFSPEEAMRDLLFLLKRYGLLVIVKRSIKYLFNYNIDPHNFEQDDGND